jgi:hypothetical protein
VLRDLELTGGDETEKLTESEILYVADALSNANAVSGQAHRRKSGQGTEIEIPEIDLSETDIKARQAAATLAMAISKRTTIALFKFAEILKFLAHVLPREHDYLKDVILDLIVTNGSNTSRKVQTLMSNQ